MEMIDVIALAHFDDSRLGAVSRKQRLRIQRPLADYLESMGLVQLINPIQAEVKNNPKTEPEHLGGDEPQQLSQPDQASPEPTVTLFRRGRRKKAGESSQ